MQQEAAHTTALTVITPKINHVLIDHENVQPGELKRLDRSDVRIWIFVGASQGKISTGLAIDAHAMAQRVRFVQISAHGSNALDFHIAYYLGRLCMQEPASFFHILSRDTGFDPLVTHLRGEGHRVYRVAAIEGLAFLPKKQVVQLQSADATTEGGAARIATTRVAPAPVPVPPPVQTADGKTADQPGVTQAQRIARMRKLLQSVAAKARNSLPGKPAALRNHVLAQFQKKITVQQADEIIAALDRSGVLKIKDGKVEYP